MMQISENISLKDRHTFHVQAKARYWADFSSVEELEKILEDKRFDNLRRFVVGGGSNLIFDGDFDGLLLHSSISGIEIIGEDEDNVFVRAGSGMVWDDFVAYAVDRGWCGAENLSGIPGNVGATPVQNIGAYGAEAGKIIASAETFNLETHKNETISHDDCHFGYRDSIFKHEFRNKYVICYVTFCLSKRFVPNIRYGDVAAKIEEKGGINLKNIRQTILEIRHEKLPDPDITGNAGSFFMNPVIDPELYLKLKSEYPDIPGWKQDDGKYKVSAAWCIEKTGWKGKTLGNAGVHSRQALVLINAGNATSDDIKNLYGKIQEDVLNLFGISLHPEVLFV